MNVLQAYLALRNAEAAQHVLDILFALQRPELEERLHGFSNAIAELIQLDAPPLDGMAGPGAAPEPLNINLVSISKPIWFYGLEPLAAQILPPKEGKLRRIAFTQLAVPGLPDFADLVQKPENDLGRLSRALAAVVGGDVLFFPALRAARGRGDLQPKALCAVWGGMDDREYRAALADTTEGGLDFMFSRVRSATVAGDVPPHFELLLRVWEVKKMKERKLFTVRWNAANADSEAHPAASGRFALFMG